MNWVSKREKAWSCWLEISKKLKELDVYTKNGDLYMPKGCGGDIVNVIEKYL